jgi:hypothetical protein
MEVVPEGGSATSTLPGTSFNSDFDSQIEVSKREHTIFGNGAVLNGGQSSALNFMWLVDVGNAGSSIFLRRVRTFTLDSIFCSGSALARRGSAIEHLGAPALNT